MGIKILEYYGYFELSYIKSNQIKSNQIKSLSLEIPIFILSINCFTDNI